MSNRSLLQVYAPGAHGWFPSLHELIKGPRVLWKRKKGSILALYIPGQGLVLNVISSIPLPPAALFQLALLTLPCLHQGDFVPTSTERPRPVPDVIADVASQGHEPWLRRLLLHTTDDLSDGHHPLLWLTPSLTREDGTISWSSSGNVRTLRHNNTLSFCPGASIYGIPQPFVVGVGEVTSPLCSSISLSIAISRVFHNALHMGSNSAKNFGLYTFPKSVLQQLKTAQDAEWMAPFRLPIPAMAVAEPT
jgi:hypothetical protein